MAEYCGIYGYEITRAIEGPGFRIEPRTSDHMQAALLARERATHNLTAVVAGPAISESLLFDLEATLSFVEHLDVVVTSPVSIDTSKSPFDAFPSTIKTHPRHDGGGAVLPRDIFFVDARSQFIHACLLRLANAEYCARTKFRELFFRKVATFQQRHPFLEVSYFLLYSGLEAHARAIESDLDSRSASEPICLFLSKLGFDVSVERPHELQRSVSTYTHLRNTLFHNAELETPINVNGNTVTLRIIDYFFNLSQLVALVVMKAVEFDDGHINWNSWIDRQPFK